MALKKASKAVDEEVSTEVVDDHGSEIEEALEKATNGTKEDSRASMERLQLATRIVSNKFGLDDEYHVTKFNDKGKVVDLTLENSEFIVSCTIKNSEAQGMYISQ